MLVLCSPHFYLFFFFLLFTHFLYMHILIMLRVLLCRVFGQCSMISLVQCPVDLLGCIRRHISQGDRCRWSTVCAEMWQTSRERASVFKKSQQIHGLIQPTRIFSFRMASVPYYHKITTHYHSINRAQ